LESVAWMSNIYLLLIHCLKLKKNQPNSTQKPLIIPLEDARRQMIYFKSPLGENSTGNPRHRLNYSSNYLSNQNYEIDTPANLLSTLTKFEISDQIILVGSGATRYQDFFQSQGFQIHPTFLTQAISCSKYVQLSQTNPNQNLFPIYVKEADVHIKKN